jgi:hypothetical protein
MGGSSVLTVLKMSRSENPETGIKGDLVLELKINKGRVKQVILDEEASTIQEAIGLRITVRTFLNLETLSPLTVPCSLFPVPCSLSRSTIKSLN